MVFQLPKQARYQLRYTRLFCCFIRLGVFSQSRRDSCCGALQKRRPAKRTCFLQTAATRSASSIRHWRRSPRFPTGLHPGMPDISAGDIIHEAAEKCNPEMRKSGGVQKCGNPAAFMRWGPGKWENLRMLRAYGGFCISDNRQAKGIIGAFLSHMLQSRPGWWHLWPPDKRFEKSKRLNRQTEIPSAYHLQDRRTQDPAS